jgi:hypothetical protein
MVRTHTILCVAGIALAGCAGPGTATRPQDAAPSLAEPPPARVVEDENSGIHRQVERELGPEAAAQIPPVKREPPQPIDPEAQRLIWSMLAAIPSRAVDHDGTTRISVSELRNFSRCSEAEFVEFRDERLVDLLSRAGRDSRVEFTSEASAAGGADGADATKRVGERAEEGFDVWELFLSLSPADENWAVWESRGPIHVLRQARPGQPQVLPR